MLCIKICCGSFLAAFGQNWATFVPSSGHIGLSYDQCDQIGRFSKLWPANFLTIVAQIFVTFWANLKTVDIQVKTELASIGSTFESLWQVVTF